MYPSGPPMFPMPPMMVPPGMFKAPRGGLIQGILSTLALSIFGLSLLLNVYLFATAGLRGGDGEIDQTVLVEGDVKEKVAVIPITGEIFDATAERFDRVLSAVEMDANVKAVVVEVDTPGGAVTPSDEIHARIQRFRQRYPSRPVVVTMKGLATSGGYYISCAGEYVFAQPTTLTGNIGVIMPRMNVSKLAGAYGVEEVTVTAPEHGFKNAGSMYAPVNPEDNKYLQGIIDGAFVQFKLAVTGGRQQKLTKTIDEIANGKVYTGGEALALGLVDQIGYSNDAYDKAASMASLSNKQVVRYTKPVSFLGLLMGGQAKSGVGAPSAGASAGNTTVNGVNVNVDAGLLDQLNRPRLLYLWRGQ